MDPKNKQERRNKVIEVLNKARSMELLVIHQYMNQHYNLSDKDFGELAAKMKLIAIDEMRHAEAFADRIKELGGEPTTEKSGEVIKAQDVKDVFRFDADKEDNTMTAYNEFLQVARENGDSVTVKLFETIMADEQIHFNYFDNVNDHIVGLGNTYLAKIAGTPSATGLPPAGFAVRPGA